MQTDKFKKIIFHNDKYKAQIIQDCFMFYHNIGIQPFSVLPDIQSASEIILLDKGYKLIHIPMKSEEIGAVMLRLDGCNYVVLNTSRNVAYNNFAVAHELYHILIQKDNTKSFDILTDEYTDDPNEMMANAFAGNIMMPDDNFTFVYDSVIKSLRNLYHEKSSDFFDEYFTVIMLMNYFKTTYMSVVVRCFETGKFDNRNDELISNLILNNNKNALAGLCSTYASYMGINTISEISYKDDFNIFLEDAQRKGRDNIQKGLLSKKDLEYRLEGMKKAYEEVVREQ